MPKYVVSQFTVPGFHKWPEAPDFSSFLRNEHRHLFYIKAVREVTDTNREVEFIEFGKDIRSWLIENFSDDAKEQCWFGSRSCETIAQVLVIEFSLSACEVYEDNENGAIVTAL